MTASSALTASRPCAAGRTPTVIGVEAVRRGHPKGWVSVALAGQRVAVTAM